MIPPSTTVHAVSVMMGAVAAISGTSPTMGESRVATSAQVAGFDDAELFPFAKFEDGWDGEGAPKPSIKSLRRARDVMRWAAENGLAVSDIAADVLGGMGIWLRAYLGPPNREAWIAFMNSGDETVVMTENGSVTEHAMFDVARGGAQIRTFLVGGRDGPQAA